MEELEDQSIEQSLVPKNKFNFLPDNIARSKAKHAQELDQPECSADSSLTPNFEEPKFEAKIRGLEELINNLGRQKLDIIQKLDDLTVRAKKIYILFLVLITNKHELLLVSLFISTIHCVV